MQRVNTAAFGSRVAAFLLDMTALFLLGGTGCLIFFGMVILIPSENIFHTLILLLAAGFTAGLTALILVPAYFVVFHSLSGETPGKLVVGIRAVGNANDMVMKPGTSFLRVVGYLLSALPLSAGFIWALLDPEGRAWHDRLAGTRVIYNRSHLRERTVSC